MLCYVYFSDCWIFVYIQFKYQYKAVPKAKTISIADGDDAPRSWYAVCLIVCMFDQSVSLR
jgi:hypothetical protein